ncbi:MAG: hypothetical protein E7642_05270 [Ruminococcaceae bacterium]|nr:hypothetical protein [Oscillospiraceae bacterium]
MNSTECSVTELFEEHSLEDLLQDYVEHCSASSSDEGSKTSDEFGPESAGQGSKRTRSRAHTKSIFPNLAGFCRYLGIATEELEEIARKNPYTYERILTVLEDEALNSDLSATLLSAYLKKRLGYEAPPRHSAASSQLQICFEHDILEDGE